MLKLFFMMLIVCIPAVLLAEKNINPDINDHYQNPDVEQWRNVFERDGRTVWNHRHEIIQALNLRQGQQVADVGTGTGFFALMMAEKVGSQGKVYVIDIAKNFVEAVLERAKKLKLKNIEGIVNDQKSVRLPKNSVDLVFICDTYHHFEYPQTTLKSISTALGQSGEVVVIDYVKDFGHSNDWVKSHVRGNKNQVIQEFKAAGFDLAEELKFMKGQYFLRFRK